MADNIIDTATLARLEARAQQAGITMNALLNQLRAYIFDKPNPYLRIKQG